MARYYRRRYTRTIVRAPRKKWCSNMLDINISASSINQGTQEQPVWTLSSGTDLAVNKTESTAPSPVVVKTGNFKLQADFVGNNFTSGSDMTMCICYVPEGVTPIGAASIKDLMIKHPEWIIAWKKVDLDIDSNGAVTATNKITLSSRLKRNLNSGDKISMFLFSTSGCTSSSMLIIRGMCQFWTCAN